MRTLSLHQNKKSNLSQKSLNDLRLCVHSKYTEISQLATYDQYQVNTINKSNLDGQINSSIDKKSNFLKSVILRKLQDYPQIVMHLQVKLLQSSQQINDKNTDSKEHQKKFSFSSQLHQQQLQECQQQSYLISEYFQHFQSEYFNEQIKQLWSQFETKHIRYSEFTLQLNQSIYAFKILEEKIYSKVYDRLKQGITFSNLCTKKPQLTTQSLSSEVINLHMSSLIVLLKDHGKLMESSDYISTTSLSCLLTFYQVIKSQITQLQKHILNPQSCKQLQRICSRQLIIYARTLLQQADISNVLLCLIHSIGLNAVNHKVWGELIEITKKHGNTTQFVSLLSGWFLARPQDIGLIQMQVSSLLIDGQDQTVEFKSILDFQLQLNQIQDNLANKDIHGILPNLISRDNYQCNRKKSNSSNANDNEYVDQLWNLLKMFDENKNTKEHILFDYLQEVLLQKAKHSRNLNPALYDPVRFSNRQNIYSLENNGQKCQESSSQVIDKPSTQTQQLQKRETSN